MPYWLSAPAMDLSIVRKLPIRDLRGIWCPSYVFAAKRSCNLSCPLLASRVFSQPPLFARSHDLLGYPSTNDRPPKGTEESQRDGLRDRLEADGVVNLAQWSEDLCA